MLGFFRPQYMPCSECGASLASSETDEHVCDDERRVDFQMFRLREAVAGFEAELGAYLATPRGRFELWYAERARGQTTG